MLLPFKDSLTMVKGLTMQPSEFAQRVNQLTNHQWKLLEVLIGASGEWVNRRHIADHIGKRRLIPYDIACLQTLESHELINVQRVHDDTPIGYQVVYRASDKTVSALAQLQTIRTQNGSS